MSLVFKSIAISGSRLLEKALSFAIILIASRHFGTEGIGEFFYYFSTVSLFIPLMDVGFEKLLVQQWWNHKENERKEIIGRLISIKLICGILAFLLAVIIDICVRGSEYNATAIFGAFLAIYLDEIGGLFRTPQRVNNVFTLDIIIPFICRILTLVLLCLFFGHLQDGYQMVFIYAASNAVGALISCIGLKGYRPRFSSLQRKDIFELLKAGIPFSLTSLCVMISLYVDSIMLAHFSLKEVGLYNASYRIILVIAALSGGTCHILFPKFAKYSADGNAAKASETFYAVLRIHLIIFGTFSLGGILLGDQIIEVFYGQEFIASALPFKILSLLIIIVSFTNVIGHTLEALGQQKRVMSITIKAALFNFTANLIVIPFFGMIGASCTTVITEIITIALQYRYLRSSSLIRPNTASLSIGAVFLLILLPFFLCLPMLPFYLSFPVGGLTFLILGYFGRAHWLNGIYTSNNEVSH